MTDRLGVPPRLPGAVYSNAVIDLAPPAGLIRVPGVARYLITRGEQLRMSAEPNATDADVACFRDGPVHALQLLLDGVFALRAAAVEIGRSAVVICGAPAAGKSAVSAALALRGHAVLADKLAPVTADTTVPPTADTVEIWPPMAKQLGVLDRPSTIVRPALAKRAYRIGPPHRAEPSPVSLVILLSVDPRVEQVTATDVPAGLDRVRAVAAHQAHRRLVSSLGRGIEHLEWLTSVAEFPMVKLARPRHGNTVDTLADVVEERTA